MEASETHTERNTGRVVASVLVVVGGIVALVGCLLSWIVLDFGRIAILIRSPTTSLSANAWSLDGLGKTAFICAIVLLVAAILVAAGTAPQARSALGIVIVVTGAIIALVAIFEMARKGSYVDNLLRDSFSSRLHRAISDVEFDRLKVVLNRLGFSVSFGPGLYLAVIGGILAVIGGVLVLIGSKQPEPVAAGFATFAGGDAGPAAIPPPPPADPVSASVPAPPTDPAPVPTPPTDPAPVPTPPADPPPMPMPPDVPPPATPPDTPPLPTPLDDPPPA